MTSSSNSSSSSPDHRQRRPRPSLASSVGGIPLDCCIYNASGPRTGTAEALAKIRSSCAGAVLTKSATLIAQAGNPQPRTWHDDGGTNSRGGGDGGVGASMNSEGLPNNGIDYYLMESTIDEAVGTADVEEEEEEGEGEKDHDDHHHDETQTKIKPYIVSISGKTLDDNLEMLKRIVDAAATTKTKAGRRISAIELNLACPNVIGKPIIGYDFDQMKRVLEAVSAIPGLMKDDDDDDDGKDETSVARKSRRKLLLPLGVKLPPYFDGPHFDSVASILNANRSIVRYVVTINTVGNALSVDAVSEAPRIACNDGLAGLSGPVVKYTALSNVRQLRRRLDDDIDVVGVGGISTGTDAFEMMLCGARAVQIGTCHWREGPRCFDRIASELRRLMIAKGYDRIDDFRGKLKEWTREGAAMSREIRRQQKKEKDGNHGGPTPSNNNNNDKSRPSSETVIAVLLVIIAALLADRFGFVTI